MTDERDRIAAELEGVCDRFHAEAEQRFLKRGYGCPDWYPCDGCRKELWRHWLRDAREKLARIEKRAKVLCIEDAIRVVKAEDDGATGPGIASRLRWLEALASEQITLAEVREKLAETERELDHAHGFLTNVVRAFEQEPADETLDVIGQIHTHITQTRIKLAETERELAEAVTVCKKATEAGLVIGRGSKAEIARLREALEKYSQHDFECAVNTCAECEHTRFTHYVVDEKSQRTHCGVWLPDQNPGAEKTHCICPGFAAKGCNCGLAAALAPQTATTETSDEVSDV